MKIVTEYGEYPSSGHIMNDIASRLCEMYQKWCNDNDRSIKVGVKKYYSAPYNKAMGMGKGGYYFDKTRLSRFFRYLVNEQEWDFRKDREYAMNPPKDDVEVMIRYF